MEVVLRNALAGVIQQRVGVVAEQGVDVHPGIVRDVPRQTLMRLGRVDTTFDMANRG